MLKVRSLMLFEYGDYPVLIGNIVHGLGTQF